MTEINTKNIAALSAIIILTTSIGLSNVYAEENKFKMVGDITPVFTFTFRDGVETHEFPVFNMSEDLIDNSGTGFSVQGIVTNSPLLHKALDEAYKYRLTADYGFEYPYKYFDVDVSFEKNGESIKTLDYNNCRVDNYRVETLDSNDYESYFKDIGFAVVDIIDFECSGVSLDNDFEMGSTNTKFTDYGESGFKFASNMRTLVTFSFDGGMEKIEFPVFTLKSGFQEVASLGNNVPAEFHVEGLLSDYPLLYNAVEQSKNVSGIGSSSNTDFEVIVEFTNGQDVLRGIDFRDCRVTDAKIVTKADKEEGFTGKSGFALVNQFDFQCAGLKPINPNYATLGSDTPIWKTSNISHTYTEPIKNSTNDVQTVVTFTYPTSTETIEFSMFTQSNVLTTTDSVFSESNKKQQIFNKKSAYPTLELRGIVGNYPILYKYVDDNRKYQGISGTHQRILVDIDVNIMNGDETLRGFNYSHCRPLDYTISTNPNNEESYTKNSFALENIFNFECQGYHPNNPVYDAMYDVRQKADTISTGDLRNTDSWKPGFFIPSEPEPEVLALKSQ